MIDWFVEQKLRFQRGTGHVSYLMAIINIYIAMKVSLSSQYLPSWVYALIPIFYISIMWGIGRYDEKLEWSRKELTKTRAVNDSLLFEIAKDVKDIKQKIDGDENQMVGED